MNNGISFGILQPHLKFRWQILFFDVNGEELVFARALTRQATKISKLTQNTGGLSRFRLSSEQGEFNLEFEEDVNNTAMLALQQLNSLDTFTVKIQMLGASDEVVKTTTVTDVRVGEIKHSELDYGASTTSTTTFTVKIPPQVGKKIDELRHNNPVADMMYYLFTGSKIEAHRPSAKSVAVTSTVTFSYTGKIQIE